MVTLNKCISVQRGKFKKVIILSVLSPIIRLYNVTETEGLIFKRDLIKTKVAIQHRTDRTFNTETN